MQHGRRLVRLTALATVQLIRVEQRRAREGQLAQERRHERLAAHRPGTLLAERRRERGQPNAGRSCCPCRVGVGRVVGQASAVCLVVSMMRRGVASLRGRRSAAPLLEPYLLRSLTTPTPCRIRQRLTVDLWFLADRGATCSRST